MNAEEKQVIKAFLFEANKMERAPHITPHSIPDILANDSYQFLMGNNQNVPSLENFMECLKCIFNIIHYSEGESKERVKSIIINEAIAIFEKNYKNHCIPKTARHRSGRIEPFCFKAIGRANSLPSELIKYYINTLNIDAAPTDENGNTLLMWLIANAQNAAAKALLEATQNKAYSKTMVDTCIPSQENEDSFATAAIHLIVAKGYRDKNYNGDQLSVSNLELLHLLLENGANIDETNKERDTIDLNYCIGNTALHLACARRDREFIAYLIKKGANPNLKNAKGQRPQDLLFISENEAYEFLTSMVNPTNFEEIYTSDEAELMEIIKLFPQHSLDSGNTFFSSQCQSKPSNSASASSLASTTLCFSPTNKSSS